MIKLLHCADVHLDSPLAGYSDAQRTLLKQALLDIPGALVRLCRTHGCDLLLLAGDVFDGGYTPESLHALRNALEEVGIPVFISPGNHDFCGPDSPWLTESWPANVHIFTKAVPTSVPLLELDCRVYGAGFQSMDCPALLEGFRAEGAERYHIGVFHGDPVQAASPYCPISVSQIRDSGLEYLALGHIHKGDAFTAGSTLCAWPGCPMGRGFDETGEKGVLLVTIEETASARFLPLEVPRFYDREVEAGADPLSAVAEVVPPVASRDFYRVTLTGYASGVDLNRIAAAFPHLPNLTLRDRTIPEADLWSIVDADSLEGIYFRKLHDAMNGQDEATKRRIHLAARISRMLLDGQEVPLP